MRDVNERIDLESVYDSEIAPLMSQVIAVAKRVGMPLVFSAQLTNDHPDDGKSPLFCTTVIPQDWQDEDMTMAQKSVRPKQHFTVAMTIFGGENGH